MISTSFSQELKVKLAKAERQSQMIVLVKADIRQNKADIAAFKVNGGLSTLLTKASQPISILTVINKHNC